MLDVASNPLLSLLMLLHPATVHGSAWIQHVSGDGNHSAFVAVACLGLDCNAPDCGCRVILTNMLSAGQAQKDI